MKRSPIKRRGRLRRTVFVRGQPKRSAEWAKVRRFVEARAGGMCEANTPACPDGRHQGHHAHHIRLRSQGGDDTEGNLLWICPPGHDYVHTHPAEAYEHGWLRRTEAG